MASGSWPVRASCFHEAREATSNDALTQLGPGRGHSTLELKVSNLRGLTTDGGTVRAVGRVTSLGRRAAFAEATLHDGAGRLCATATSTLLVFDVES